MTGIELIAIERRRQVNDLEWTPDHDDAHEDQSLALAAVCYALPPDGVREFLLRSLWPESWDVGWWKPDEEDRVRELVKAGALIAAEIDRLQRLAPSIPEKHVEEGSGKP